ncbi:polysaccharide deacetylase family protein [Xanthobacter autotrophicus]|uniref:polysaccharide deacetylase family protein n=1 Tax=Xanthobacter autotrophicus TaxID=280 RepID=UPI003728D773
MTALAIAASLLVGTGWTSIGWACPQPELRGRTLELPAETTGFGKVQGQPPLPLSRGEYVITIDDGPNPATTPQLLSILNDYCIDATFFLIGRNAQKSPDLVRRILAEKQNLGSHSFRHPDLSRMTATQIEDELDKGNAAVEAAAGGPHGKRRLVRLPGSAGFNNVPPEDLLRYLKTRGLVLAGYDFSPQDWRNRPPGESFATLFKNFGDRGIILFHDGQSNTIALLPMVLEELKRRDAKVVTLTF